ncbi:MAG: hypothetical protein AVDCRST_MAG14-708, partial [uncultured Rubrobacteraceae bacterium]
GCISRNSPYRSGAHRWCVGEDSHAGAGPGGSSVDHRHRHRRLFHWMVDRLQPFGAGKSQLDRSSRLHLSGHFGVHYPPGLVQADHTPDRI